MLLTALRTDTTHDLSQKRPERIHSRVLTSQSAFIDSDAYCIKIYRGS